MEVGKVQLSREAHSTTLCRSHSLFSLSAFSAFRFHLPPASRTCICISTSLHCRYYSRNLPWRVISAANCNKVISAKVPKPSKGKENNVFEPTQQWRVKDSGEQTFLLANVNLGDAQNCDTQNDVPRNIPEKISEESKYNASATRSSTKISPQNSYL
ncbi:unnamed protein product [Vicia faba]|uniref:Uncharacterized protein n=1 Tax=Vicia faba TaxID=3906 RepID=A0AAV0YB75_VICFA|nr:unnamed protein product [Vicia faba]